MESKVTAKMSHLRPALVNGSCMLLAPTPDIMKWFVVPILALASLPFLSAAPAQQPGNATHCVEIGAVSVWGGWGWNHAVYLTNSRCSENLACTVSTDVDPEPIAATAPPTVTVQVETALNSPIAWFVPFVSCDVMAELVSKPGVVARNEQH